MPKVIENVQETILQQSRHLLLESGYEAFTMRDAAQRCKIAVGTLYNYFSSKEKLAGSIMLEDWQEALILMQTACAHAQNLWEGMEALYRGVMDFSEPYRGIWAGCVFVGSQNPDYVRRHRKLVRQLADILAPLLERTKQERFPQAALFLSENILLCAGSSEMKFSSLQMMVQQLWKCPVNHPENIEL